MKKIMFNNKYGHTQAVLEGGKTMTRRIVPQSVLDKVGDYQDLYYQETLESISFEDALLNMATGEQMIKSCYKVGEVVAIAQSYKDLGFTKEDTIYSTHSSAAYRNKMFVKTIDMRNQIRITHIKVEKMQDISEEDCLMEGIMDKGIGDRYYRYGFTNSKRNYHSPKEAFSALIDRVSRKGTWDLNPYVFAYSFVLVK